MRDLDLNQVPNISDMIMSMARGQSQSSNVTDTATCTFDTPYGDVKGSSEKSDAPPILGMPFEIMHQIAGHLDSTLWLLNLSNTCKRLHEIFGHKYGNLVWYKMLPPSLWNSAESYQDVSRVSRATWNAALIPYLGPVPQ